MRVVVTASVNEVVDDSALIKRYEKEISHLRKLLKQSRNLETQVKVLNLENTRLREDNEKMQSNATGKGAHPPIDTHVQNTLHKKLAVLEQIEKDQKSREVDLDKYHQWLHTIQVKHDTHGTYSIELKDRLLLLEVCGLVYSIAN